MGPLKGLKVIEFAGVGPVPMAAMLLADLGATVLRIDRKEPAELGLDRPIKYQLVLRSRGAIALDLKDPDALKVALELVDGADAVLEGFRPRVMERLGLGPDVCIARNERLVYGRMTGWGQDGPLADTVGHDLNYIAITGALGALGHKGQPPTVPLNLLGDYAGGALYLALGVLAAVLEAKGSGKGQVVDVSIVDGVLSLQTSLFGMLAAGMIRPERGTNALDSGSHFYNVYECADGQWISIAPIEKKFYQALLSALAIDPKSLGDQMDPANWSTAREMLAQKFKTRTRDEWCSLLEGSDSCFAPVLSWQEAQYHPQIAARQSLIEVDGVVQPAPVPRFSRTPLAKPTPPRSRSSENARAALAGWMDDALASTLLSGGVIQ